MRTEKTELKKKSIKLKIGKFALNKWGQVFLVWLTPCAFLTIKAFVNDEHIDYTILNADVSLVYSIAYLVGLSIPWTITVVFLIMKVKFSVESTDHPQLAQPIR